MYLEVNYKNLSLTNEFRGYKKSKKWVVIFDDKL